MSEARRQGRETETCTGQGQIHARVSIVASTLVHLPAQRPTCPHANPNCTAAHIDRCAPPHTHTLTSTPTVLCSTTTGPYTHGTHTCPGATLQSRKELRSPKECLSSMPKDK